MMKSFLLGSLKSKTMWSSLLIAVLSILDGPAKEFVSSNPGLSGALFAALMAFLRTITVTGLYDKGDKTK